MLLPLISQLSMSILLLPPGMEDWPLAGICPQLYVLMRHDSGGDNNHLETVFILDQHSLRVINMPPKSRHRNPGSRSFLSNDLLRSIARGRSYHTVETSVSNSDLRSQSSLSCDPNAQYQPSNVQIDSLRHGLSVSSNTSASASYHDADSGIQARIAGTTSDGVSRHRKRRRLSWLSKPWSRVARHGEQCSSTIIPPATSMSSISKSSISSPVLASTTNARVANTEKVHCSEVLFPISSPPEDHSRSDNIPGVDEPSTIHGVDNGFSWTSSLRNIKAKLGHSRRASTGVLLTSSWSRKTYTRWESAGSSSVTSHRKAKMVVRGKLQHLGERLHVLPAGTGNAIVDNGDTVKAKETQPHQPDKASHIPTPRATPFLPGLHSDSTTDLLRSSLSRSFASAVDRLDLRSSPTLVHYSPSMSALRKTKSFVGMNEKYDSDAKVSSKSKTTSSKDVRTDMSKLSRYENKTRTFDSPTPRQVPTTRPDMKIARIAKPGFLGRDNHPDPLRSHSNVRSFASAPGQSQTPTTPDPRTQPTIVKDNVLNDDDDDDDDDAHAVQEAIMYSPSTGNLSQYTRTPSPIAKKAESETIKARIPEETPTKQPTLRKLKKSVSGFFIRSASKMRLATSTPNRQAKIQEESEQQYAGTASGQVPERATHDHQPFTPSPLRKSSRPDVSEVRQANRERATTLSPRAQIPDGGLKLSQSRSPTTSAIPQRRRAIYGLEGALNLSAE